MQNSQNFFEYRTRLALPAHSSLLENRHHYSKMCELCELCELLERKIPPLSRWDFSYLSAAEFIRLFGDPGNL